MAHSPATIRTPRATPVAATLVVVVTVAVLAGFLRAFPVVAVPAAVGSVGGALLALTLRAGASERPATGLAAGLLAVPAGAAAVGAVLAATLLLVEDIFPVEEEALLSVGWLVVLGHVGVVVGCSVAAFGLVLLAGNASDEALAEGTRVVLASGGIPTVAALAFLVVAVGLGTTPDDAVLAPLAAILAPALAPVAALVPGTVGVAVVFGVVALLVAVGLDRLEPRLATSRHTPDPHTTGAIAGGALAAVGVVAAAGRLYSWAVAVTIERFPAEVESEIQELSTTAAMSVGESTVALGAVVLVVGVTALVVALVRLACRVGILSTESMGSSLAAVGLFLAAVFGGTVGASAGLVVAAVVASLLVWDAGQFGTELAREVGGGPSRRVELVHLGGTLLVGVGAALVALLVVGWLPEASGEASAVELLALCSVVAGLLALVLALR